MSGELCAVQPFFLFQWLSLTPAQVRTAYLGTSFGTGEEKGTSLFPTVCMRLKKQSSQIKKTFLLVSFSYS